MNTKQILLFLEKYSTATSLPIRAYNGTQLILNSVVNIPISMQLLTLDDYILHNNVNCFHLQNILHIYKLKTAKNISIIIGPTTTKILSTEEYKHAFHEIPVLSQSITTIELLHFLNRHRFDEIKRIKDAVIALNIAINNSILDEDYFKDNTLTSPTDIYMPETYELKWSDFNKKYIQKMQTIVKNGSIKEMEDFFRTEGHLPYGKYAANDLRHFKNSMMVHIYIIRTAAHEGGLDEDLCVHLAEVYSQKCENAKTIEELTQISRTLRLDFCNRVHNLRKTSTDSQTINRSISFIHDHRTEHLSADYIAKSLGITAPYLCSEFKKRTGISIVSYIMNEKIDFAKELLLTTNESILNISTYLNFSSQNYFQSVFKKYTGVTPNQYRKDKLVSHA